MEEYQDLVERLMKYDLPRITQVEELYHVMERCPFVEYTSSGLQRYFKGFPIKGKEIILFLDIHARCNGNAGMVFSQAIKEKLQEYALASNRYDEMLNKVARN